MAATIRQFDADGMERIAATVRRLEAQVRNLQSQVEIAMHGQVGGNQGHVIRSGVTKQHPRLEEAYPTAGCKFYVRWQDWEYDEEAGPGDCTQTDTNWEAVYVLGKTYGGEWLPEDTPVIAVKIPGTKGQHWWIVPACQEILVGKLAGALSQNGSATLNEWQRNSGDDGWEACSPTVEHTVHDWLLGTGETVSSGKKVIVGRVRRDGKLIVLTAECE